ncbi:D-amino acid aminotransferase [Pseudohalioglobus sediminis]|uniref:Aminodeoxychorismate lyase n=1 Tax=Pseudohalioglobus sediminis TaxID=2606449 RepID=A0A5B0X729_9GAMM|nr:D-amino acid aminotransferase [Pseudohalioglobus sediminis]KAA1194267.1 D-amino acid aminotransferase [Pseudohalioglobus sediminis]
MSTVYLNGEYMPMEAARISPMDRGFLFGDGIYEVVPSYDGQLVGFAPHMARMQDGLDAIEIKLQVDRDAWREVARELIARNGGGNLGIYYHVSRGADTRRHHAYPEGITPTMYAFAFEIPPAPQPDKAAATPYTVSTAEDLRWKRCNIKSTALLGNVMHYQHGHSRGHSETILYNQQGEITEAAACNVFVVRHGIVATPLLDHQKLPGITRLMLLEILRRDGSIPVQERVVTRDELHSADEVWITSSSKEIAPVIEIDGKPVGDGSIGDVWLAAQTLYSRHKFDF